jgi:hypothetical protein
MSATKPATREELKQYCLRELGSPVLQINVADSQLEDRIDEALQYFQERHFDGAERMYLKHTMTSADITRFKSTNTTHTSSDGTTFTERNNYLQLPDHIIGIERIFGLTSSSIRGDLFGIEYQIFLNDLYAFGSIDILNYYMTKTYIETLDMVLNTGSIVQYRFTKRNGKLYIDYDATLMTEGKIFIIDCYRALDPTNLTKIWNDFWLKRYVTALFKRQWGQNLIKFNGVQLPGGVSYNGRQIYEDAIREIAEIESKMISDYEIPPMDAIG